MRRFVIGICALLGLGFGALIAVTDPTPQHRADIEVYAQQLFEFGAVRYVHGLDSQDIAVHQALFDQVASGVPLDRDASCIYRAVYLMVLHDYARRFQLADDDLQMAKDFGMMHANNCGGVGVLGRHDLHDLSAKENAMELMDNLALLRGGAGWFQSIALINEVQKNLVDLTVHMAPAVQSIGVPAPEFSLGGDDDIAQSFGTMQGHFKAAQFATINGPVYWENIDAALAAYADIVVASQDIIVAHSSAMQRRIAGLWLSLQTIAPRLDMETCVRPQPNPMAPVCL